MKKLLLVAASLWLSACATFDSIDRDIKESCYGKPVDVAIQRYGYPTAERVIAGRKLLTWDVSSTHPTMTTLTNGQVVMGAPASYSCRLDLEVSHEGTIVGHRVSGQMGACSAFSL